MKLLLAGGTGLTGQAFLAHAQSTKQHVTAVGRRPTGLATEDIVADFADLPAMPSARVAVCTLGTTIRAAGSQDAFRALDLNAVIAFATAAKAAGVKKGVMMKSLRAALLGRLQGPDLITTWSLLARIEQDLPRLRRCLD